MHTDILDSYSTTHLPLATYLRLHNVQLVKVTGDEIKRGTFHFVQVPRTYIIDFNNGQALVEPNEFAIKMSQLVQTVRRTMEIS